jgi:hypothetical protein
MNVVTVNNEGYTLEYPIKWLAIRIIIYIYIYIYISMDDRLEGSV